MSDAMRRSLGAIALLVPLLATAPTGKAHAAPPRPAPAAETVPGSIVVRFRRMPPAVAGARFVRPLGDDIHLLHADPARVPELLARLSADPNVAWVEPEHVRTMHAGVTANDTLYKSQWSLPFIRLPDAWVRTRGSADVVVAVLDTGILPHPDLKDRYLPGFDFVTKTDNSGDGDARDPDPTDPGTVDLSSSALHGLHVTGIIGARVNNALGIAGIDWNCKLLPVRVLGVLGGKGSDSDIADGIRWAAGLSVAGVPPNPTPAAVINISFGGPGLSSLLQAAIDSAVARGTIIVASAGNDAADTAEYSPAGQSHVIAVGAVDEMGRLASYSNRGARVDIVAPGGSVGTTTGIISTTQTMLDGWTYINRFGTSQAAPHVTGVVALMRAVAPELTPDQALKALQASANPSYRCMEGCGAGLLEANSAIATAILVSGCIPACESGQVCRGGYCLVPGAPVDVVGGCAVTGAARSRGALAIGLALLVAAALAVRGLRRRSRRV